MSKKILFTITILISLLSGEEMTFSDRTSASVLKGFKDGIIGITNNIIDINISKNLNNMNKLEKEEKNRVNEIKRLKESVKSISAERYKYIHFLSEERDKNRKLKRKIIELEKTIKKYNMKEADKYFIDKKDKSNRAKAKADLKRQLSKH